MIIIMLTTTLLFTYATITLKRIVTRAWTYQG
jgi:hypothetical protein